MKRIVTLFLILSICLLTGCSSKEEQLDSSNKEINYFDVNYDEVIKDLENYTNVKEENLYYINDIYDDTNRVYSTAGSITYGVDYYDNPISLYNGSEEVVYEKGLASWGGSASYTITNVLEYGYDYFETYIGTTISARDGNFTPSFEVRIVCDSEEVEVINITDSFCDQVFISVDLEGVQVLQIYIDNLGNGIGDFIGLGDPVLIKETSSAYLDVFDLEFNQADQVTISNLLEYPEAYDIDGNDISDDVKFTTNYQIGEIGTFDLTYYLYDSNKVLRRRDVKLTVTGEDYSEVWTIEDFKTPYVNYMYHARQAYPEQMKRFFDLILINALDFDENDWYKAYRSNIYTSQNYQVFNLLDAGIYLKYDDANTLLRGMHDSEPRSYMILNLDLMGGYYCTTDSETGLLKSVGLWAQNKTNEEYDAEIELIIENSETFLAESKDDMTYAQSWNYVTAAYASWITYTDGAFINSSLGLGLGKCNGNSMGLVHLSQRLNIKSIYAEGWTYAGLHAWTYQKLPDEDAWYLTDKLWGGMLSAVEETSSLSSHEVYTNRGYDYPLISTVNYDSYKLNYPSVWATFNTNTLYVKQGNSLILSNNIISLESIFDGDVTMDNVTIELSKGNQTYSEGDIKNLPLGIYTVTYTIEYNNFTRVYELDLAVYNDLINYSEVNTNLSDLSVYGGIESYDSVSEYDNSDEVSGKGFTLNDGASTTIDISNLDVNTLSLKYGMSVSTRTNDWTMANGSASLSIYADGVLIYSGSQLTAWSTYEDIFVIIPDDTKELTFVCNKYGSGGNHSSLIDLVFGKTY